MSMRHDFIRASKWLRIFGYATFSVRNLQDKKVQVSRNDLGWFIANLIISCIAFYFSIVYSYADLYRKSLIHYVILTVDISISAVCIISIICAFMFRNEMWKYVTLIDAINESFLKIGINAAKDNFLRILLSIFCSIIFFTLVGTLMMTYFMEYYKRPIGLFHFAYLSINFSYSMFWALICHGAICRRFRIMNNILRWILDRTRKHF